MYFKVEFLPGEYFWGGATYFGEDMPICASSSYERDFRLSAHNQMMPLYVSNCGRYIWSSRTFRVWVEDGALNFEGEDFEVKKTGNTLRDAYLGAMQKHFPFSGKTLPREFFRTAQYNTWMEFTYFPTQEGVLDYARNIIKNGFEPGILIIDEGWQDRYGVWQFDTGRFPDPKAMIDSLHEMGFIVMLWVTPYVSADGLYFVQETEEYLGSPNWDKMFLRNNENQVALVKWWNGYSAVLDLRKECDKEYLDNILQRLMKQYGVDGFKFDGGNIHSYNAKTMINGTPRSDHDELGLNIAWNEFGERYTYHEYKDTYKGGGKATIERLADRGHAWEGDGINTILPCSLLQGLMGHPFICPDMIGGGQWTYSHDPECKVDEELFVRMAQASALFPMMQFSWAPWRALSKEYLEIVKAAAKLHHDMSDEIILLVAEAEQSGEPVLRHLAYNYPGLGYETVSDQFMLGKDILVCPVVTKGTFEKDIVLPPGIWEDDEKNTFEGGRTIHMQTPLHKLTWFRRKT